jgi:hypothetical protein
MGYAPPVVQKKPDRILEATLITYFTAGNAYVLSVAARWIMSAPVQTAYPHLENIIKHMRLS